MATAWRPHIREKLPDLERLAELGNSAIRKINGVINNQLSLQIYITNGTSETLRFVKKNVSTNSTQHDIENGWELRPNHVKSVRFSENKNLGFTVSFALGNEPFCIRAHSSISGMKCFSVDFQEVAEKPRGAFSVVSGMPEFMGFGSCKSQARCKNFIADVLHVYDDRSQIHIYLGETKEASSLQSFSNFLKLDSMEKLEFAEWCAEHDDDEHRNRLGNVLFLAEFSAVEKGLPGACLEDQAFALDLLAATFVSTDILNFSDGKVLESDSKILKEALQKWKSEPGTPRSRAANQPEYTDYHKWASQKDSQVKMEKHIENARMLLMIAGRLCAVNVLKARELWKPSTGPTVAEGVADGSAGSMASAAADAIKALQFQLPDTEELNLIKRLVINGISQTAEYKKKRERLIEMLVKGPSSASTATAMQHYSKWLPLTARLFTSEEDSGCIELFSAEVFSDLDSSQPTDPQTVQNSLGSEKYLEDMKTNSMSGELFFHSTDEVFMVKTISKSEGKLLRRMAPSYKAHVKDEPFSFMCRYAGLLRIEAPGVRSRYVVVMRSVFDPGMKKGLEVFDLKGTLVNRKKKEGQSCGKDQDWKDQQCIIKVPRPIRSEVCAVHARDVAFLLRFGVMDYSMLVGSIACGGEAICSPGWRQGGGLVSVDKMVHFMGLIDHLVEYDLLRDCQNLLEGDEAEIVPPDRYAARQVQWFRENVVEKLEPADEWGTVGRVKVQKIKGHNIKGYQDRPPTPASSDPHCLAGIVECMKAKLAKVLHRGITTTDIFVVVKVGLWSDSTEVRKQNNNQGFEDILYLPVDATPEDEIVVEVWQKMTSMVFGDKLLGKLTVDLQQLLNAPGRRHQVKRERLISTEKHGQISLELIFESAAAAGAGAAAASNAASQRWGVTRARVRRAKTATSLLGERCTIC